MAAAPTFLTGLAYFFPFWHVLTLIYIAAYFLEE